MLNLILSHATVLAEEMIKRDWIPKEFIETVEDIRDGIIYILNHQ